MFAPTGRIKKVSGTAVLLRGDDVDTDRIMPARFLRVVTFNGLEEHVFEDDRDACRAHGEDHPFDDPRFRGATILIVNRNFGCGSSREHAPQGLMRHGIRAIVGESFAEIFFGNAAALGIPCVVAGKEAIASLMDLIDAQPDTGLVVDLGSLTLRAPGIAVALALRNPVRAAFLDGTWDATGLLLEGFDQVQHVSKTLPYLNDFAS